MSSIVATSSGRRQYTGAVGIAIKLFCVACCLLIAGYTSSILVKAGIWISPMAFSALFIGIITILTLLFYPASKSSCDKLPWYDVVLIAGTAIGCGYPALFYSDWQWSVSTGYLPRMETVFALWVMVALFEACRRALGLALVIISGIGVLYLIFSEYAPGFLLMQDIEFPRIAWMLYAGEWGMFGEVSEVAATVISIYVIFGVFLERSQAGQAFMKMAMSLMGRMRGGPAKAAVVASGIFGTFSGSPSANVAGTGPVTIPLMKSIGYPRDFAGGVEAAASTGGNFMPPVMGAAAFVMASWLGMPYYVICISAAVPAILYYLAIYVMVDAESVKLGLRSLPRSELPRFWPAFKDGWYWLIPIAVIIILLVVFKWSAPRAGFYAVLSIFPLALLRKHTRISIRSFVDGCQESMSLMLVPAIACGTAGIFMAAISMTGIGIKLSSLMVLMAAGNKLVLLLLTAFAAYILGLGLSSVAVYIVCAVLVAPALHHMGVPQLHSHLFVYYFGMLSHITPPVATASFVAAGIAGGDPNKTSVWSMRLAIIALIIPFAFVYNPALLIQASPIENVVAVLLAIFGTVSIGLGVAGAALTRIGVIQRVLLVAGGCMMYWPEAEVYMSGLVAVLAVLFFHVVTWRAARTREVGEAPPVKT